MAKESAVSAVANSQARVPHRERSASLPPPRTTPRKLALLIGCNYKRSKVYGRLLHPHNDVIELKKLLVEVYHYKEGDITLLLDDDKHTEPIRENIILAMKNLVANAMAGDKLFFHFSGHGEQTECHPEDKTEVDGMDEAIVPCDATSEKETWIIDNEMNRLLVRKIPVNAQLIAFFDMCHSGTALDLKHYCYNEGGTIYTFKRTSHDKVENESRRLQELPFQEVPSDGQNTLEEGPRNLVQKKRMATRRFTVATRKNTLHCEFSEASTGIELEHPANARPSSSRGAHRGNTCMMCGKLRDEDDLEQSRVQEEGSERNERTFVPDRPLEGPPTSQKPKPVRKKAMHEVIIDDDDDHAHTQDQGSSDSPTRRHTIASPRERKFGCFSTLHLNWLPHFIKSKFRRSGGNNDEKVRRGNHGRGIPSRAPTFSSITHLLRSSTSASIPESSASTSTPATIRAPPSRIMTTFNARKSTPASAAPALDKIDEDGVGDIVRCQSPQPLSPSSPTAPTSALSNLVASTWKTVHPGDAKATHQQKCGCRVDSGWQGGGQVISIGAAHDEQLSWEPSNPRGDREDKDGPKTLTAALVEILRKEAHPTFAGLLRSIQTFLNEISDDMRKSRVWQKRHDYVKLRRKAKRLGQQQQEVKGRPTVRRSRSASESVPTSTSASATTSRRNSHQAGNDVGVDMFWEIDESIRRARGGPIQQVMLGSEHPLKMDEPIDP